MLLSCVTMSILVIQAFEFTCACSIGRPCGSVRCSSSLVTPTALGCCGICTCRSAGAYVCIIAAKISTLAQVNANRNQKNGRTRMEYAPDMCEGLAPASLAPARGATTFHLSNERCIEKCTGAPCGYQVCYERFVGVADVSVGSCCSATALRIEITAGLLLPRPRPNPPPRPTSSATMPTTMGTHRGVPPVVGGGVVAALVVAGAFVTAPGCTVKTKAPSSGSPSKAETVIQRTTYTPFPLGLIVMDICLGSLSETWALPWLIRSPQGA